MRVGSVASAVVAGTVCLAVAGAPAPAAARVRISVEIVFGAVAVGGAGLSVAMSGGWESFAGEERPQALIEVSGGRTRFGMPHDALRPVDGTGAAGPGAAGLSLSLARWRF